MLISAWASTGHGKPSKTVPDYEKAASRHCEKSDGPRSNLSPSVAETIRIITDVRKIMSKTTAIQDNSGKPGSLSTTLKSLRFFFFVSFQSACQIALETFFVIILFIFQHLLLSFLLFSHCLILPRMEMRKYLSFNKDTPVRGRMFSYCSEPILYCVPSSTVEKRALSYNISFHHLDLFL
jgi:hypothetical protein